MRLRTTMFLVLVVILFSGWVKTHQDAAAASHDRARRAHLKRRVQQRLIQRGITSRELESQTEELLSRLHELRSETQNEAHPLSDQPSIEMHHRHHHQIGLHRARDPMRDQQDFQLDSFSSERSSTREHFQQEHLRTLDHTQFPINTEGFLSNGETILNMQEVRRERRLKILDMTLDEETEVDVEFEQEFTNVEKNSRLEQKKKRKKGEKRRRDDKKRKREDKKKKKKKNEDPRMETLLEMEDAQVMVTVNNERYIECCPSKIITTNKTVGRQHLTNGAVFIKPEHSLFLERICLKEVEGKECIFPARSLKRGVVTRCAQQYSYSQAIVRPYNGSNNEWVSDFIQVYSGCSCQVNVTPRKKKKKKKRKR